VKIQIAVLGEIISEINRGLGGAVFLRVRVCAKVSDGSHGFLGYYQYPRATAALHHVLGCANFLKFVGRQRQSATLARSSFHQRNRLTAPPLSHQIVGGERDGWVIGCHIVSLFG
jgi:hypothetical protein